MSAPDPPQPYQSYPNPMVPYQHVADEQRPDLTTSTGETLTVTVPVGVPGSVAAPGIAYRTHAQPQQQPEGLATNTQPGIQPEVVTSQPMPHGGRTFQVTDLDAGSQLQYAAIHDFHHSGQAAVETVHGAANQLLSMIDSSVARMKDNITYDDLLQTLIHENERILTKEWRLMYRQATFYDCQTSPPTIIDNLPSGAAILTNKRLLLLSAQVHKGMSLQSVGAKKKERRYVIQATNSDNVHYKPLPLSGFASIELSASSGTSMTANVDPIAPCCRGWCTCCGVCCVSARKRWTSFVTNTETHNTRVLKIGLLLPPWGNKCMLHIDLDPHMPLSHARDFMAMLQQHPKLAA